MLEEKKVPKESRGLVKISIPIITRLKSKSIETLKEEGPSS